MLIKIYVDASMRFNCLQILFNISYIFILIFLWIKYISYNLVEFVYCSCSFLQIKYIQWFRSLIWVHVLFLRQGEVPKIWFVYQIRHNELYVYIFVKYKKHGEMSMKWVFLWNTTLPFYPITYLQFYFCLILLSQPHYPI